MAVITQCPKCGRRTTLLEGDVGPKIICSACGKVYKAPRAATAKKRAPDAPQPVPQPAPQAAAAANVAPPPRRALGSFVWTLAGAALVLAIVLGGVHIQRSTVRAEVACNRATAVRINSEARDLARSHHLYEASAKYQELFDFLGSQKKSDPALLNLADDARHDAANVENDIAGAVSLPPLQPVVVVTDPVRPDAAVDPADSAGPVKSEPAPQVVERTPTTSPTSIAANVGPEPIEPGKVKIPEAPALSPAPSTPPATAPSAAPERALASIPTTMPTTAPARPPVQAVADSAREPTDEQIGDAIQGGVNFLIARFDPKTFELRDGTEPAFGRFRRLGRAPYHDGADVLCVYALMQCGQAIADPRLKLNSPFMAGSIAAMKRYQLGREHFATYSLGLRATALALNNRNEDRQVLVSDVGSLINSAHDGAYSYNSRPGENQFIRDYWDNSNSQYGLLGVWSGAEVDVEVPNAYWAAVEKHWTKTQSPGGAWSYTWNGEPRTTMTCAGIASLFVCHDWLDAPKFGTEVGRDPYSPALKSGLNWLEQDDHSVAMSDSDYWGYALYGVERAGLASGFKSFGTHNWYAELAQETLKRQNDDGSWDGDINTAYALLFLSRGRHPIIMNKLRYDGYWANRPRDISNLARFASHDLERPVNWQTVRLDADWSDWADSPILYLASHVPPRLANADVAKIRQYVMAGGMLFVQADGDAPAMAQFAAEVSHRLFPQYEMMDVPPGHPLFTSDYKLPDHPPLRMVTNGARILMLFSPTDISHHWQLREQRTDAGKPFFQLGINMFIYATGRRDLRNRLDTNAVGALPGTPTMTVKIARVQYAGPWDPEPYAWTRFARWFRQRTNYGLDVQPVPMRALDPAVYPFAHLTGTARYNPAADEIAAVKNYVERGGVLLIDLAGGTGQFDASARDALLGEAFPDVSSSVLDTNHPLLLAGASGMEDLTHPRLRPFAVERLGTTGGTVEVYKAGKGHVLFTSLDITCGLLNTGTWGIIGYDPSYSQAFLKNAIFWTLDGQKDP